MKRANPWVEMLVTLYMLRTWSLSHRVELELQVHRVGY
jgi:hypothetical protein